MEEESEDSRDNALHLWQPNLEEFELRTFKKLYLFGDFDMMLGWKREQSRIKLEKTKKKNY